MLEDHLLFRSIRGHTSREEEQAVASWRASSPANEQRYQELQAILAAATRGRAMPVSGPPPASIIIKEAARRGLVRSGGSNRVGRAAAIGIGLAAAAVLLIGGPWLTRQPAVPALGVAELITGASETATVSLSDGTVVRLAPNSRLRALPNATVREVDLDGRGFFAVAKQNGRPFRVQTPAGAVTVLGTRFDVESRDRDLRMIVVEGAVSVDAAEAGTATVTAGHLSRVVAGRLLPTTPMPDLLAETRWVGRFLAFQNTPLRDAALEIERVYSVKVVVDSAIADQTVTTWLADRELAEVVRIVCAASLARCSVARGVVTISRS